VKADVLPQEVPEVPKDKEGDDIGATENLAYVIKVSDVMGRFVKSCHSYTVLRLTNSTELSPS
jgi:hypothetical protein